MLPTSVVERLVMSSGLRFGLKQDERRQHARYPLRATAQLFTVQHKMLSEPSRVTIRDISVSGVGVVVPRVLKLTAEWVLKIDPRKNATAITLQCRTLRVNEMSSTHSIVGALVIAILSPGQVPMAGRVLPTLDWLSTVDVTPDDAFGEQSWN